MNKEVKRSASYRRSQRNSTLKRKYGITIEVAEEMRDEQDNCCGICGTSVLGGRNEGHIDHCHRTGKVRGLLCINCNTSLGGFKDDVMTLQKAVSWLMRSKDWRTGVDAGRCDQSGENNPMYGRKHSEETLAKISKGTKGKNVGADNGNYGRTHTEKAKRKISEAALGHKRCVGRVLSQDTKDKISKAHLVFHAKKREENIS